MSTAAASTSAEVRTPAPPPAPLELPAARQYVEIDIDLIEPSCTNFRKKFDEEALSELAESIRDKGVVEPVIVRPVPAEHVVVEAGKRSGEDGWFVYDSRHFDQTRKTVEHMRFFKTKAEAQRNAPRYELVAGERRWRASKIAAQVNPARKTIPALVCEYSDRAALEVQIVENDQREDITPLERAAGFQTMIEKLRYSVEDIARKVNKSPTFVRSHLKLANLPPAAAEALERGPDEGGISRSVAELIARIPDEKMREKAAKEIVTGYANSGPMTYRDARAYVERGYMKELKGAPFDQADANLVPAAGPCTACQHCSANTPEQYQGKRTDMCLLPSCFAQKVEAHHTQALAKFRDAGHTIIPASEAKEMFKHSDSYIAGGNSKYALLSDSHYESGKSRTYRSILGKGYKAIVAQTPRGTVVELCLKADVRKALDADRPKGEKGDKAKANASALDRRDPEHELMERAVSAAAGKLVEKIEAGDGTLPAELLRHLITEQLDMGYDYECVTRRRGIACKEGHEEEAIEKLLPTMGHKQLVGLYVELSFLSHYWHRNLSEEQAAMLKVFGIDFAPIKVAVKKWRDEWQQKLKTATTADVVTVEVAAPRLKPGGDIESAKSLSELSMGKQLKTFEYEGEIFSRVNGQPAEFLRAGEFLEAVRVVPRAGYKGKTFKYGEKGLTSRGAYEGLLVQCQGAECVLTGPTLKCVPAGAKKAADSGQAKPQAKGAARSSSKKSARAAAGRRS